MKKKPAKKRAAKKPAPKRARKPKRPPAVESDNPGIDYPIAVVAEPIDEDRRSPVWRAIDWFLRFCAP